MQPTRTVLGRLAAITAAVTLALHGDAKTRAQPSPDPHAAEQAESPNSNATADSAASDSAKSGEAARERLRESLALLGFDPAFFQSFQDNQPLSEAEQGSLARLLHGLPRIARATLVEAAQHQSAFQSDSEARDAARGQSYALRMQIDRVTRAEVPQALREALGFEDYYLCQAETVVGQMLIATRHIPRAWKLDAPLNEQATAIGLYLKRLPADALPAREESETGSVLLFAAERVAWHPPTLLAHLGVDYGLFDGVQDRAPLKEREIFYQLLAAAGNMTPEYEDHQIRRLLKQQLELQARLAQNGDLPATERAAAERALERARAGASDVVPLFNAPQTVRGELVVLRGEALRALEIRVEDPQIRRLYHINHYFEVDVVTPDSQNNPIVCCLAELPPQFPLGESIHESVRVAGFFLKGYAFATRRTEEQTAGERQLQVAPLIVGRTLAVIPTPSFGTPTQSLTLGAGLLIVIAVCGAFMWHMRRMDRRAQAQLKLRREALPEAISLGDQPAAGADKS